VQTFPVGGLVAEVKVWGGRPSIRLRGKMEGQGGDSEGAGERKETRLKECCTFYTGSFGAKGGTRWARKVQPRRAGGGLQLRAGALKRVGDGPGAGGNWPGARGVGDCVERVRSKVVKRGGKVKPVSGKH